MRVLIFKCWHVVGVTPFLTKVMVKQKLVKIQFPPKTPKLRAIVSLLRNVSSFKI